MRLFFAVLTFVLFSCQAKKESSSDQETIPQEMNGDYEFYAGAVDNGYLYYKLSLTQRGGDLSGSFFAGVYLSKNDQGYTMPAATTTSSITGRLGNGSEVVLYLGNATDTTRLDKTYTYPEPEKIFDVDGNGDPVIGIQKVGNDFQWIHQGDTLLFVKVAATKPKD